MKKLGLLQMIWMILAFCAATAIASTAQILTALHSFGGGDGAGPVAGLIQATDGNFYGTTSGGGGSPGCGCCGCGTVFKITASGTLTTLYSFCSHSQTNCIDGSEPYAELTQANDGNFYGTTEYGGASGNCYHAGCGTVFKITPGGTLTTLYSFGSQPNDGAYPFAGLVQATDDNFYGTTYGGGGVGCAPAGCGTVFKITPSGTLTTLHSFDGTDGGNPYGGLIQATDGNFYGTTSDGGANGNCDDFGCGTVFKITPGGTLTTLYSFCSQRNCTDGAEPVAGLIQATDGNFYGTTSFGGVGANNYGTVFKITPGGTLTTLFSFCSQTNCTDGQDPHAGLVQASDGNFYGTTFYGGASGGGEVFRITASGTLTTLHSFTGSDGADPDAGLVQARDGNFYGTTVFGGANGLGTVFRLVSVRPCFSCALQWK